MSRGQNVVHDEPVWRDRTDFIIAADVSSYGDGLSMEQMWARRMGDRRFEICCIPFFAYDLALGDIVEVVDVDPPSYIIDHVVERSGRFVFRAWFSRSSQHRQAFVELLVKEVALHEWASPNLVAIDARDEIHARHLAGLLQRAEDAGELVFETGRQS